jgi:hypothetical protein
MNFNSVTYFTQIARKLKAIGHTDTNKKFFRASNVNQLQELIQNLTSAQYPALILFDKLDGRFEDNTSNNPIDRQFYSLLIVKPVDGEDSDSRRQVIEDCKAIVMKIFARMTRDWLAANKVSVDGDTTGLRNFDRGSAYYNSIGPISDNLFGTEYAFTIREAINTKLNEADWDELA